MALCTTQWEELYTARCGAADPQERITSDRQEDTRLIEKVLRNPEAEKNSEIRFALKVHHHTINLSSKDKEPIEDNDGACESSSSTSFILRLLFDLINDMVV
jgi:hypothetical protein